jgi:hypothetical protein
MAWHRFADESIVMAVVLLDVGLSADNVDHGASFVSIVADVCRLET